MQHHLLLLLLIRIVHAHVYRYLMLLTFCRLRSHRSPLHIATDSLLTSYTALLVNILICFLIFIDFVQHSHLLDIDGMVATSGRRDHLVS